MALKFGTSGVRGLVTEMTDRAVYLYTTAYVRYLLEQTEVQTVALGGDFRSSTPAIKEAIRFALQAGGYTVTDCGYLPTPALAAYAMKRHMGSVMVTGSHIPDDRNGIKFYLPRGEVLKADEAAINAHYQELSAIEQGTAFFREDGSLKRRPAAQTVDFTAGREYVQRYVKSLPARCLDGLRLVHYEHSAVGRDLLTRILRELGAQVTTVGRSDRFVPVDTEAVEEPERLAAWVQQYGADALVSMDGDSDRPLVVDEQGEVLRGDVLGILVSQLLQADFVATPVSCNTALEHCGHFATVRRTRIGSPYVIAAMRQAPASCRMVVGYEANGGYLTNVDALIPRARAALRALPTRDAVLPIVALLTLARSRDCSVSELRQSLPRRYTDSGLIRDFPSAKGKALVDLIQRDPRGFATQHLQQAFGNLAQADFTDGARLTFVTGSILHLRPSGNAPEFRVYTETGSPASAVHNCALACDLIIDSLWPLVAS